MLDFLAGLPDPVLIVLVGPSGSGKSLLAQENWPGQVVSSDALRALTGTGESDQDATADAFAILHQVAARDAPWLTTCVDAANVTRAHRAPLIGYASDYGVPAVAVVAWPRLETCLERNTRRPRYVPEDVIRCQYIQLTAELPSRDEGFARVIVTGGADWAAGARQDRLGSLGGTFRSILRLAGKSAAGSYHGRPASGSGLGWPGGRVPGISSPVRSAMIRRALRILRPPRSWLQ